MKSIRRMLFPVMLSLMVAAAGFATTDLPKVTIMGKSFYQYVTDKGESLAGIANKFGWDLETLTNLNRDVSSPLDKGTLLHYPVRASAKKDSSSSKTQENKVNYPLEHKVKSGETIYGISRQYDLPVDVIYAANPGSINGIKAGQVLLINPDAGKEAEDLNVDNEIDTPFIGAVNVEKESDSFETPSEMPSDIASENGNNSAGKASVIFYTIEDGDSLYGISKKFNTSITDLFAMNPGLKNGELHPGEKIKISPDSKGEETRVEKVVEKQVEGISSYKVKRGDTWESIAMRKDIDVRLLKDANPGVPVLKRGEQIAIPEVTSKEVEKTFVVEDPRETSPEGRQELYNQVHAISDNDISDVEQTSPEVTVALVLNDVSSNKDLEFARGALLAIRHMKSRPFRTRLAILDGSKEMLSVIASLDSILPSLVVTTADKGVPQYLAEYVAQNGSHLINAFDVKDETYINNPNVVQYLAPTSYFNDEVAAYIKRIYDGYDLIIADPMDETDFMGRKIVEIFKNDDGSNIVEVAVSELTDFELEPDKKYIVYATSVKKNDVKNLLDKVSVLRDRNPIADLKVIGRPNWIMFADSERELFGNNYVLMPTRFYFNAQDDRAENFINDYKDLFGHGPIKSYPVYSATAYDIMTYFVPNVASTSGDFNAAFVSEPTIQSAINLNRVSNWGGIVNPSVYVIEFAPFGIDSRVVLTPGK